MQTSAKMNSDKNTMAEGFKNYTQTHISHWDKVALRWDTNKRLGKSYLDHLKKVYRHLIPQESNVIEIGCGKGDLLASLSPKIGIGVDFSEEAVHQP